MIDLYYWPTPNGHKITIILEELGLEYSIIPVDIGRGDQFERTFLEIAPNNRIPAIVDHQPADGDEPISIFESGAILWYLAEKHHRFVAEEMRGRYDTLQWLFWQMGNFGPMLGQNHHFVHYAPQKIPYAVERYVDEASRLYAVLNRQLEGREFINGDYSISDMACYPWTVSHERQRQDLNDFPEVKRWHEMVRDRPAVQKAYSIQEKLGIKGGIDKAAAQVLFGQDSSVVRR